MSDSLSLKDHLFNTLKVAKLTAELTAVYPDFQSEAFQKDVVEAFPKLELKERITWISECLRRYLPADYKEALSVILSALPPPCDPTLSDDDFGEFIYAPYAQFISTYGCDASVVDVSLSALEEVTTRCSAEYAIRRFISEFPEQTLMKLREWATHQHYHVRRLVSEGTRPKLPWAPKIPYSTEVYLPLLEVLFADKTRYVTRSIANHLNDVSKVDPEAVLKLLRKWKKVGLQTPEELAFMSRHSLRTLVKQGHQETLSYLGFSMEVPVEATLRLAQNQIRIGEVLTFELCLQADQEATVVVDFVLNFQGKNGRLSEKVFKLKTVKLSPGISFKCKKNYTFTPGMSTRTFYPGEHRITLQLNGIRCASEPFMLLSAI